MTPAWTGNNIITRGACGIAKCENYANCETYAKSKTDKWEKPNNS